MRNPKSIAVVGLGAIGGWAAAKMAQAGHRISAVARGQTLAALKTQGLLYSDANGEHQIAIAADDDSARLGPQDIVIVAVKGPALAAASASVAPLIGPNTVVIPMMNGVPWWFLADRDPEPLRSIDPAGETARNIPTDRVLGCVVHASCTAPSPGRIVHKNGNGLIVGEPRGGGGDRLSAVADLFRDAGFAVTESGRIDAWPKGSTNGFRTGSRTTIARRLGPADVDRRSARGLCWPADRARPRDGALSHRLAAAMDRSGSGGRPAGDHAGGGAGGRLVRPHTHAACPARRQHRPVGRRDA